MFYIWGVIHNHAFPRTVFDGYNEHRIKLQCCNCRCIHPKPLPITCTSKIYWQRGIIWPSPDRLIDGQLQPAQSTLYMFDRFFFKFHSKRIHLVICSFHPNWNAAGFPKSIRFRPPHQKLNEGEKKTHQKNLSNVCERDVSFLQDEATIRLHVWCICCRMCVVSGYQP